MKKFKVVMVIAILTVALFGVGYAMWAESITINSTVSTGELKEELMVTFLNYDLYSTEDKVNPKFSSETYEDIKLIDLEKKLRALLTNVRLQPGEYANINSTDRVGESVEPYIDLYVSDDAGNNIEDKSLEFDIVIKWKQFNK